MNAARAIDMSRRDRAMNAVGCAQCGAEVGDPCTGWKDPSSVALHNQRWLAARINQTAEPPKGVFDSGSTTPNTKRVSDGIYALVIVEAKTHEIAALIGEHQFRWTPSCRAYVRLVVDDIEAAKKVARKLFDDGYAVKLHAARPQEILCWERDWSVYNNGTRQVVRRANR